jgi:spore germination cell wall hydrolase CwlJ-like protein
MLTAALRLPGLRLPTMERRHWLTTLVLATMLGLYLFAGLSVSAAGSPDVRQVARIRAAVTAAPLVPGVETPPPEPEPLAFQEIAPQDAVAINAAIPVSTLPNPAAKPFVSGDQDEVSKLRSLDCLTAAVYYEAAIESSDGQRAVAQVVLNRVRHPAYPKTVCGVVFQGSERTTGCQFTFTCDGALGRVPAQTLWLRARKIAEEALAGKVFKPVGWATHYHTNWVVPYWSGNLVKAAVVGTHIFYRWEGGWGTAPAFHYHPNGIEPDIALMHPSSSVPPEMAAAADAAAAAAAAANPDPNAAPGVTSADVKVAAAANPQNAIIRRYEPIRQEAAVQAKAQLAQANLPASIRWALTGGSSASSGAPLGKKATPAQMSACARILAGKAQGPLDSNGRC